MPSEEQQVIIAHPSNAHARVLAGPGTGKSTTVLQLAERLQAQGTAVRVVTFTRNATAELAERAQGVIEEPTTVHGFALSVLMRNPGRSGLPEPLRIPDEWETQELIHDDLAKRLRAAGFDVTVRDVRELEHEMASRWESLDPARILLADANPALRDRYLAIWQAHRSTFGYSLFAEMPLYAGRLIEDLPDADVGPLEVLVVDEYQDLNMSEIALIKALAARGIRVVAVGDDDQSIYLFRMAHPRGIQEFCGDFPGAVDYTLSISFRCGREILNAASLLVETTPGRVRRPALRDGGDNPPGLFRYLRFENDAAEREGVARIIRHMIQGGLRPPEIAVLMRVDPNGAWSRPLRASLAVLNVPSTDVESALAPLQTPAARRLLAIARLAIQREDGLAWWSILRLARGVSEDFEHKVADECQANHERFGCRVLALAARPPAGVSAVSLGRATEDVAAILQALDGPDVEGVPESDDGWATWLLETAQRLRVEVTVDLRDRLLAVGRLTPQSKGLAHYLNQLEPITKDLAVKTEGVAIMTMQRSKGLTFKATLVVGVEEGVVPFPRGDQDEERRLLYVAMTRAREQLYLTMARQRRDLTRQTGAAIRGFRERCPFFRALPINIDEGPRYLAGLGA